MSQMDLNNRLAIYGYRYELEEFDALLSKTWWVTYQPQFKTVERMLQHPTHAIQYCNTIRELARIWINEDEVLGRLMNLRKSKYLDATKPN